MNKIFKTRAAYSQSDHGNSGAPKSAGDAPVTNFPAIADHGTQSGFPLVF